MKSKIVAEPWQRWVRGAEDSGMIDSDLWIKINKFYSVNLIMTPSRSFAIWDLNGPKEIFFDEEGSLNYDVIPVRKEGQIIGLMTKERPNEVQPLTEDWLITRDTPISKLVELFTSTSTKKAFLVTGYEDEIVGIVTPADLNKLPTKMYLYALIGDLELQLSDLIRNEPGITIDYVLSLFSDDRSIEIRREMTKLETQNVDTDIYELLYLAEILNIIKKTEALRGRLGYPSRTQADKHLGGINNLRTPTMHPVKPLLKVMPRDLHALRRRLERIQSVFARIDEEQYL